jgi:hypothetical protein
MATGAEIIHRHDLYFDGGDPANGSLYLCAALGTDAAPMLSAIETLRKAGLWSQAPHKQVPQTQKDAYAQQMQFIESFPFANGLLATRYDHPKFPSSAERFARWRATLTT